MHEHQVNPDVIAADARATGLAPASLTVEQRLPMAHQANHLYDVWAGDHHLIAKEFFNGLELGAPSNEYRALRLVESMDIAPRPLFYDPAVGTVVVHEFLAGAIWDRRAPTGRELAALADLWVAIHGLPIENLWVGRGQARSSPTLVERLRAPIESYAAWADRSGDTARRGGARLSNGAGAWPG